VTGKAAGNGPTPRATARTPLPICFDPDPMFR
jgi:hypothetical protein